MLSIYVVSSWVLLQVVSITWQPLGLPEKSVTFLIILLLIGFPIYILLLWKLRLAALEKAEIEIGDGKPKKSGFQKMYFSSLGIIATLCAITAFLIVNINFSQQNQLPTLVESDKIAVLKFGNNTGDPKYDIVSKMASDWIMHGITENHLAQVISQDVITQYSSMLRGKKITEDEGTIVREYLKPGKIISGNFYLKNDKLLFQGTLIDGKTDRTIIAFKSSECSSENPLDCIDALEESITGYLITEGHKKEMLQEIPPKYEAYKYVLEAKYTDENSEYIKLLNNAIASDPDYFEPKVLRVGYYYNIGDYEKADSLRNLIKPDSHNNTRQVNLLNMYDALLRGNNKKTYQTLYKEYEIAPFDLKSNRSMMTVALQMVNRPEEIEPIFKEIKMDSMELQNCSDCIERLYVKGLADSELKKYSDAIKTLEPVLDKTNAPLLQKPLIRAYVRSGNDEKITQFLNSVSLSSNTEDFQDLCLFTAKEYLLLGNKSKADAYFTKTINLDSETSQKKLLAEAYFGKGNYSEAERLFKEIHHARQKDTDVLAKLAIASQKTGKSKEAQEYLSALEKLHGKYKYGSIEYALAQYYAATGDEKRLYENLMKAVASGYFYTPLAFHNDPLFLKYKNSAKFQEVLTFWH